MIETPRLVLRPFRLADVAKLYAMSREAGMRQWIPDQVYRDEAHAEQVARALIELTAQLPDPRVRPYVLGVEDAATRVLVGHVGLSPARGSVEIGYAIEDAMLGRGLATEAVTAMVEWGLGSLALPEVLGIVGAANVASRRVLEKARFVLRDDAPGAPQLVYRRTAGS
jgi:RimJ/RimL family protein N-acetyltransferase